MATTPRPSRRRAIEYPTSDGKPMAETDIHRQVMVDLIEGLEDYFADDPMLYVSGDLLLFYEEGNRRKHVAPDVFVGRGVAKRPPRDSYLLWEEGRGPDLVIEVTSRTTRREDQTKKLTLYRDVLKVPECFQFDPTEDYLKPPFQGHRLIEGRYEPITPVEGRLPSAVLGLHLERSGLQLRLCEPVPGQRLPTRREARLQAEAALREAEAARQLAEARQQLAEARQQLAEAEAERLRREIDELRRRLPDAP